MSSTIFRYKNFRFFFFSKEEARLHVHISSPDGEAKFWLEPVIALADYVGFSKQQLLEIERVVREHDEEVRVAWGRHFRS